MEQDEQQEVQTEGNGTDQPDVPESRRALVEEWEKRIIEARKDEKLAKAFKQMRKNQYFAAHGGEKSWVESGKYTVPIIARHINQSVANLYAKNPKAVATRKRRRMYTLWDGREDSLQAAMEGAAMGDPNMTAIVEEILAVRQHEMMLDGLGETMEILWEYFLEDQSCSYKQQIKAAVRRTKVCKVSYIKLGFQRILEPRPEVMAEIEDITSKITAMECLVEEVQSGEVDERSARIEELRLLAEDLKRQDSLLVREGPVLDFPRSDEITIDPDCRHLKTFSGAGWIAQMYEMTPKRVKQVYKVDIKGSFKKHHDGVEEGENSTGVEKSVARIHEIWDKRNQQTMTICEGYHDFLIEPHEPENLPERFWPLFPIVFNEIESDDEIFPPSDVEQTEHIQKEYNRSREGLRQHRIANRPYYVHDGSLTEAEQLKLAEHLDHEIIAVTSLGAGQKMTEKLQRGPTVNIEPALYDVEIHFSDLLRSVGTQEANLGGTAGNTATESSIAESSRSEATADNVDDLDFVLTELAKAMGDMMLRELSKETVIEIVGDGAVWPDMPQTREQVAKDINLTVKAGSSGRPNQAAELAKIERAAPVMIQIPGLNPKPLARRYAELLDLDPEEMTADGMPSITAINAMMAKIGMGPQGQPTGEPGSEPAAQGPQGAGNAPGPQQNENEPGPQPAYPAPMAIGT